MIKRWLLKWIAPDYEQLKDDKESLICDIYNLTMLEDSFEGVTTRQIWVNQFQMEEMLHSANIAHENLFTTYLN